MNLVRAVAPSTTIVSSDDLLAQLRVEASTEGAVIAALVSAVDQHLDGPEGFLCRALLTQTWTVSLDRFPHRHRSLLSPEHHSAIRLPLPPLQAVTSITYLDTTGTLQTLSTSAYVVAGVGSMDCATVRPVTGTDWPCTQHVPEAVTVTFRAGFGDAETDVPAPIRQAALMIAATWFQNRESVVVGNFGARELPQGAAAMLAPFRTRWGD